MTHLPARRLARRDFIGALALAPAALACATAGVAPGAARPPGTTAPPPARAAAARSRDERGLESVRNVPLPPDAEPALVFRAATALPGAPR